MRAMSRLVSPWAMWPTMPGFEYRAKGTQAAAPGTQGPSRERRRDDQEVAEDQPQDLDDVGDALLLEQVRAHPSGHRIGEVHVEVGGRHEDHLG